MLAKDFISFKGFTALLTILCALQVLGVRQGLQEHDSLNLKSFTDESVNSTVQGGCSKEKTYYFQFAGSAVKLQQKSPAAEGTALLKVYSGMQWKAYALHLHSTFKEDFNANSNWNKCFPKWWDQDRTVKGCSRWMARGIWKLTKPEDPAQTSDASAGLPGFYHVSEEDQQLRPLVIPLDKISKLSFAEADPEEDTDQNSALTLDYTDTDGATKSLKLEGGSYYPERVLQILVKKLSWADDFDEPIDLEGLEASFFDRHAQATERGADNTYKATGGRVFPLSGLVGAIAGGVVTGVVGAPISLAQARKDAAELAKPAADKLWERFGKCGLKAKMLQK